MPLKHSELLPLKRWNTPTIYNGWEQITKHDIAKEDFNLEPLTDYMPEMGPIVGPAVTVRIEPSNKAHSGKSSAKSDYRDYVASVAGPKIVVVQDWTSLVPLAPLWGEVNSYIHRALGCVGSVVDGAIRDVNEMKKRGIQGLGSLLVHRTCLQHSRRVELRGGGVWLQGAAGPTDPRR